MKLTGRVLHLVDEPTALRAQLNGESPAVDGHEYLYAPTPTR